MNYEPLFINFNSQLIGQVEAEAGDQNRVTSSFAQSVEWINNPALPLSSIYLNPNDSNFSALQFLNEVTKVRPATPVFIMDEQQDMSAANFASLAEKFKIKGVLKTQKDLLASLKHLQIPLPESIRSIQKRTTIASEHPGYIAVPILDFIYSKNFSANVFVEDTTKSLRFFAMEGSEVDLEYLSYLAKRTPWLYIEESSVENRIASFKLVDSAYLDPAYLSPSWRTAETFYRAKQLLNKIKNSGVSQPLVQETYTVFQDLFQLTSQFTQDLNLKNLMDQARRSDRAIHSVILSVLLCKQLKYEKSGVVETLGVASLLQDISLYQSPYGNISEINPTNAVATIKNYYLDHPNLSAKLVEPLKGISELTLQIIRQQHERNDRTGYPAKVGGAQLQPLAEVLSLINSYLEARLGDESFYAHYSERVTAPFKQLVAAMVKAN